MKRQFLSLSSVGYVNDFVPAISFGGSLSQVQSVMSTITAAPTDLPTFKSINGAASATLATAVSNFNTAMATFLANAGPIWDSAFPPTISNSGYAVLPDAAVANCQSYGWANVAYKAA